MKINRNKWVAFANIWNNHKEYKKVADVAQALETTVAGANTKARKYKYYLRCKPELKLPPIIDRSKVTSDGFVYIQHDITIHKSAELDRTKKRFVVSAAQYGADVNKSFLNSLKTYCEVNEAQLIIMPMRYGASQDPIKPILDGFMTYGGHHINKHLEMNLASIVPTAKNPLTGMEIFCGERTQIFAHPQIAFETIGRTNIHIPKAMMTTGAVTYPDYGFNRTSEIAEMMHNFGAVVIEVDGEDFHFRHVMADSNGHFNDYVDGKPKLYTPEGVFDSKIDGLVCGDWHTGETCPQVSNVTYLDIVPSLKPKNIYKHDFFNGHSVSHHDEKCAITMMKKEREGLNDLDLELEACSFELALIKRKANGAKIHIVASNHNDHLDKYISEERYKKDIRNKEIGMNLALKKVDSNKGAFELAMLERGHDDVNFMGRNEEHQLHDIELSLHGDVGINGAKGTGASFKRISFKCIIGHAHSPSIRGGCFTVGTSTPLRLGYTKGLTGWLNTHAIIYDNGQRQQVNIIKGKWYG